jgi:hypothetical protein
VSDELEYTADILRNKGVPVRVVMVQPMYPALSPELSAAQVREATAHWKCAVSSWSSTSSPI